MRPRKDVDVTGAGLEITANTPLDQLPQFITPDELARILRIGSSLAYELCKKGEVRSKKVGRCVRIPRDAVVEYIDDGNDGENGDAA